VTNQDQNTPSAGAADSPTPASTLPAGTLLRQAREAAGMSIDAAAQQLKLHPRQVKAIEDGEFALLPGRTFVRGFVRNYARLLRLDADRVLDALPGAAAAPALESPTLHETAQTMGELPTSERARPGWTRWAIPLTLVAVVAAAAIYEFVRGQDTRRAAPPPAVERPVDRPAERPVERPGVTEPAGTPLPNPMSGAPAMPPAADAVASPSGAPVPPVTEVRPAAAPAAAAAVGEAPLVLTFRGASWAEVRDRTGRVLLSQTVPAGQAHALSGTPPFELHLGNAQNVAVTFNGKPVDLAPYTRQNIARFTLP
jgi:cytoskeleton protein RodZ